MVETFPKNQSEKKMSTGARISSLRRAGTTCFHCVSLYRFIKGNTNNIAMKSENTIMLYLGEKTFVRDDKGRVNIPSKFTDGFGQFWEGRIPLHFRGPRSRTARNVALDYGLLILSAPLFSRDRSKIDFDYLFKAKVVTFREGFKSPKSPSREMDQSHIYFL